MAYVFGRQIRFCSFLLNNLAALYDGACMLFITGRIGWSSLCVLCRR